MSRCRSHQPKRAKSWLASPSSPSLQPPSATTALSSSTQGRPANAERMLASSPPVGHGGAGPEAAAVPTRGEDGAGEEGGSTGTVSACTCAKTGGLPATPTEAPPIAGWEEDAPALDSARNSAGILSASSAPEKSKRSLAFPSHIGLLDHDSLSPSKRATSANNLSGCWLLIARQSPSTSNLQMSRCACSWSNSETRKPSAEECVATALPSSSKPRSSPARLPKTARGSPTGLFVKRLALGAEFDATEAHPPLNCAALRKP
mmetsp:Transcript_82497/g.183926  ORF Transcript_82497/g.183926 Transcript_82497/m.183926 type:complete len:261 (+) Transcript_82497:87-869(+)